MRAEFVENTHLAVAVPEGHQPLAKERNAQGGAVGLRDLHGDTDRKPIAPEDLAHGRARGNPANSLVVTAWKHGPNSRTTNVLPWKNIGREESRRLLRAIPTGKFDDNVHCLGSGRRYRLNF